MPHSMNFQTDRNTRRPWVEVCGYNGAEEQIELHDLILPIQLNQLRHGFYEHHTISYGQHTKIK